MDELKHKKAFTLVELIIVITILVILATIAFVSFQNYTKDSREANRLTTINNISKGLDVFQIKTGFYPEPEKSINILANSGIIGKQGFFGENQSSIINMDNLVIDPLDENKFTYYTDVNKKKYQLLLFLEGNNNIGLNSYMKVYAEENYINRFPKVYGNKLGILLDINNNPVQTLSLTGIDIIKTNSTYKAIIDNTNDGTIIGTGLLLTQINPKASCKRIFENGGKRDGIYKINPSGGEFFDVYCDMTTDGGGWTLVAYNKGTSLIGFDKDLFVSEINKSNISIGTGISSLNVEGFSKLNNTNDAMLKSKFYSSFPIIDNDTGIWSYDYTDCSGKLGHTGRTAGCSNHYGNDSYLSSDKFNIAVYPNTNKAIVPYHYSSGLELCRSGGSRICDFEFYLR